MKQIQHHDGFTLIELIMVIALLGVVAIFAIPRLISRDFEARGFHDETLALLRYAQKTAIAHRRTVCVAFTANPATLTLTIAAAPGAPLPGVNPCPGGALVGPDGQVALIPTPQQQGFMNGITYAQIPAGGFFFDALGQPFNVAGQPSAAQTIQVASDGVAIPQIITVEPDTGYVHD